MVAVLFKQGNQNVTLQPMWQNTPTMVTPERDIDDVRWFVLKEPVELSKAQALRLKAIFHSNARPVQPLHGRVVKESM